MGRCCALLLIMLGLLAGPAFGCSCLRPGGCRAMPLRGTLFVGDVLSVRTVAATEGHWARQSFRLKVTESLAGPQRPGDELEVSTGMGGGDCGYEFTLGERYFIDAYGAAGALSTGICSSTQPLESAGTLLRELHAEAAGSRLPDLTGEVVSTEVEASQRAGRKAEGLAGVSLVFTSGVDGSRHGAETNADGVYTLSVLPPGKYRMEIALPPKLTTSADAQGEPTEIEIPQAHGAGAACHLDVFAFPAGAIKGKLIYPQGKPLEGVITAYRVGVKGDGQQGGGWMVGGDGSFSISLLPAGDYLVEMFETTSQRGSRSWYPGTGNKLEAKPIHVEDGVATTGVEFVFRP